MDDKFNKNPLLLPINNDFSAYDGALEIKVRFLIKWRF